MKAILDGTVIAQSDETVVIENNHYFPPGSINREFLRPSDHRSICPWKGEAYYYDVVVGDVESRNAAWTYPHPKDAAAQIKDYVAFWKRVEVTN